MFNLDYSLSLIENCEGGFSFSELEDLIPRLKDATNWLYEGAKEGKKGFGFLKLPYADTTEVKEVASFIRENFDAFIVVGIGGSSLGCQTIFNALCHLYHNELSKQERNAPRFYVIDNVDPTGTKAVLDMVELSQSCFNVISKSGSTAETMANFLVVYDALKKELGDDAYKNVVVTTDKEKGALRQFALETGCVSLEVPTDVEGRFSVLSPVGLLTAAVLGIDIDSMLAGASDMDNLLKVEKLEENLSWMIAGISYILAQKGKTISVMMPYSDNLEYFCSWYTQLWAESLGKDGKGQTPIKALGTIDQHSQIQLYNEGPKDKLITIITIRQKDVDIKMPMPQEKSLSALSYLSGHTLFELLNTEAKATARSIAKFGNPVIQLEIPQLNAYYLGALFYLYEVATGIAGHLFGVNPFNQPGVELGKKYTYALMGRAGYEEYLKELS